jgi:predicted TIM-barrel fold metal-dependent hydrolase
MAGSVNEPRTHEVTDAQVHVWRRVSDGGNPHGPLPFGHADLIPLMDGAGVERAVLIPPSWASDGNSVALDAARAHPRRFGVMGLLQPFDPSVRVSLKDLRRQPGMLGLRQTFHAEPYASSLRSEAIDWLWEAAAAHAIPIMVYAPGLLSKFFRIAERYPDLKLIIDHIGLPPKASLQEQADTVSALTKLANCPNVAVKVSGLPVYSTTEFPFRDMHDSVCRLVEAFGPERTFWASNITRLRCTYSEAVEMMNAIVCLSNNDLKLVMGAGLTGWLDWPSQKPALQIQ